MLPEREILEIVYIYKLLAICNFQVLNEVHYLVKNGNVKNDVQGSLGLVSLRIHSSAQSHGHSELDKIRLASNYKKLISSS